MSPQAKVPNFALLHAGERNAFAASNRSDTRRRLIRSPESETEKPVSHKASAREAPALQWFMERNDYSNFSFAFRQARIKKRRLISQFVGMAVS